MWYTNLLHLQDKLRYQVIYTTTLHAQSLITFKINQITEATPQLPVAFPVTIAPVPQRGFRAISIHAHFADSYSKLTDHGMKLPLMAHNNRKNKTE